MLEKINSNKVGWKKGFNRTIARMTKSLAVYRSSLYIF